MQLFCFNLIYFHDAYNIPFLFIKVSFMFLKREDEALETLGSPLQPQS